MNIRQADDFVNYLSALEALSDNHEIYPTGTVYFDTGASGLTVEVHFSDGAAEVAVGNA